MNSRTTDISLLLLFILSIVVFSAHAQDASAGNPKEMVKGSGCERTGVEGGCLVLSDFKTKKTYNLFFQDKTPDIDMAISFEGPVHEGPTTCMQGTPIDVSKWTQLKMKCAKSKGDQSAGGNK